MEWQILEGRHYPIHPITPLPDTLLYIWEVLSEWMKEHELDLFW